MIPMIFPFTTLVDVVGVTTTAPLPVDENAAVATAEETSRDTVKGPVPPLTTVCGNGVAQNPPDAAVVMLAGVMFSWKTGVGVPAQVMTAAIALLFASAIAILIVVPGAKSLVSVIVPPLTIVSAGRSVATV